ncbi:hypothetical protein [Vibrio proteolyticus]
MTANKQRIVSLDFLRGLVIFMAVFEHYTGYLNYWYKDFFIREYESWDTVYTSHLPMIGKLLPMDSITANMCLWLVPWVSQIYLALAAFNLAMKTQEQVRAKLAQKLLLFASIIGVLYVEGFVIAPNFGEAISFYPVMLWMVLLALFSLVYGLFGIRGMMVVTVLSFFVAQLGIPDALSSFEAMVRHYVHPDYELDARLDLFMASGCLGFMYGWVWHHKPHMRDMLNQGVMLLSVLALALFFTFDSIGTISLADVYAEEHSLAENTFGRMGIWGTEFLVISTLLWLHSKGIDVSWRPLNWIGMFSLTVFIFHKSIFIFLWGPLMTLITAKLGMTLVNNFFVIFTLSSLSILMIYGFKRSGIICHLMGLHQDNSWKSVYAAKKPAATTAPEHEAA